VVWVFSLTSSGHSTKLPIIRSHSNILSRLCNLRVPRKGSQLKHLWKKINDK
jgi:hypothetical protein